MVSFPSLQQYKVYQEIYGESVSYFCGTQLTNYFSAFTLETMFEISIIKVK